jgi:ligand-binding sensor domain-containing protein
LSNNRVRSILEDNKGKIWLATANGITTYENGKFSIITTPTITGNLNYTKAGSNLYTANIENNINCILQDSKGIFGLVIKKVFTNLMVKIILISPRMMVYKTILVMQFQMGKFLDLNQSLKINREKFGLVAEALTDCFVMMAKL